MNKYIITLILITCFEFKASAQAFSSGIEYLNFLGQQSAKVTEDMWDYTRAISKGKGAKKIANKRLDLVNQLNMAIRNVRSRPAFNKKEYIKAGYISYYQTNLSILNEDYSKIMNLEEIAEKSYDAMEQYIMIQDKAEDRLTEAAAKLQAELQLFANENNITLTEEQTKTSKRLKRAGDAFEYYRPIYLIFFKALVQENNFLTAYTLGKVAELEQANSSLLRFSTEGISALGPIADYNGDQKLKEACMKLLQFLKSESEGLFTEMAAFKLKEINFQKLNTTFSKKKKNELSEDEINQFNEAVADYNQSAKSINPIMEKGNKERAKAINAWNDAVEDFLKKHAS